MNAGTSEHSAMDALWEAETTPILWFQGLGDWFSVPFELVTALGSQTFVIILIALVFWCVHAGVGARLFVAVIASTTLNALAKSLAYGARPYWFSANVSAVVSESSFGIPSGHAQGSTVLWGYLGAKSGDRRWMWAAGVLIALICLSRVYLGVHFISDVLAGLLLGGAVLWAALRWEDRVLAWWRGLDTPRWAFYLVLASLLPCLLAVLWQLGVRGDWAPPADWIGSTPQDPAGHTLNGLFTAAGALLGGVAGLTLLDRRGGFSASGALTARAARFALGISVVLLIEVVGHLLARDLTGLPAAIAAYAVYTVLAFWATFAAPELFVRSGLAARSERGTDTHTGPGLA
ncbi:PAP2 superfamily protein [Nocardiopsis sp. Huas11]|uniref:phosphatase PAP2 family protein n=1 Tax=Nocardiopsis sp. Huas11 TaxID=2183912 RepID=UPI000F0FB3E0|nr:phosphatase PAP2 family protein [Nocardiopsis sp. Huas11]RKS09887.1 PAP2 superfamily protein [Nocardiopsis sp. Huas11]